MASKPTENTLASAMAAAFSEIEAATKSANNPHFKSKYADLGAVIEAIKPPLIKHGLFFTQRPQPSEDGIIVETVLHHCGGETLSLGSLYVPANKRDPQGFGSAMTYARRYALQTAFGVPTEDDDGNAASKAANDRPTTGETPPSKSDNAGRNFAPREKLEGPYSSGSALQEAIRKFAAELDEIQDIGSLNSMMEAPETVALEKQALRYLPGWWETGAGCAADFVPMALRIHRKRRELTEIDEIANASGARYVNAG